MQSLNKPEMEDNTMNDINKERNRESADHQEKHFFSKWILPLLIFLLLIFSFFLYFSLQYLLDNWEELTVEEILYHIKSPMGGASESLVQLFILSVLLPAVGLSVLLIFFYFLPEKKFPLISRTIFFAKKKMYLGFCFFIALLFFSLTLIDAWDSISLGSYLSSQLRSSKFIEENYVDPKGIELHFPEKKRNLIYIYMESTELTFMDEAHGGAFPDNLLPEMTALSKEGEDFSGAGESRNGGIALPGATWTMGAIFAQSTGLPLKISIEQNSMDSKRGRLYTKVSLRLCRLFWRKRTLYEGSRGCKSRGLQLLEKEKQVSEGLLGKLGIDSKMKSSTAMQERSLAILQKKTSLLI